MINREWKGASREMVGLGATLAILVFGLTVSVVHYTNIVQPGGRHLYAFLISISIYCIYSVKGKRKYPIKNNTCPSSDSAGVLV